MTGYSNGASLALKYTLDAVAQKDKLAGSEDKGAAGKLKRVPDHVFLLSPMIAVDNLARYSPVFIWLGDMSFFSKSRWIDVQPEYDPHKYNSFPVNAALQSYKISTTVASQINKMYANGQLQQANGKFTMSVVSNADTNSRHVAEIKLPRGQTQMVTRELPYKWPGAVYSLTHVAIPFPLSDEIYGLEPDEQLQHYPHLRDIQLLGESGALILPPALLQRLRSNPFYGYVQSKMETVISADINYEWPLSGNG